MDELKATGIMWFIHQKKKKNRFTLRDKQLSVRHTTKKTKYVKHVQVWEDERLLKYEMWA